MKIIFVCSGNTCRSPMAEGILRKLAPEIQVSSRGIMVYQGNRTARHTVRLLKERLDIDLDKYARQIRDTDCRETDYIITMTQSQADFIRNLGNCGCVYTLTEFAGVAGDVPDPYGGTLEDYERTYDCLEELIAKAVRRLEEGNPPDGTGRILWDEESPVGDSPQVDSPNGQEGIDQGENGEDR